MGHPYAGRNLSVDVVAVMIGLDGMWVNDRVVPDSRMVCRQSPSSLVVSGISALVSSADVSCGPARKGRGSVGVTPGRVGSAG